MKIAVLADPASWYFRDLHRAIVSRGHTCFRGDSATSSGAILQNRPSFHWGNDVPGSVDCLIVRSMPAGSLEQVVLRMDLLAREEARGTLVINNPKSLECAIDKYLTTARLASAGLPVPDTVCCQTAAEAMVWFERLGGDVVVKPLFGAEGRGIVRVNDPDLAWRVMTTLERIQSAIYLQRFIDHGGCDYRLLVLNGEVLGGMCRRSAGDFRTNIARSGTAFLHQPTSQEVELAQRAAAAVGTAFAGIDLLYDAAAKPWVIEVNAVPGWRAFAEVNRMDVAVRFVGSLELFSR